MKKFEGLWIPIEILQIKELSLTAKVFFSMIICLDNKNGCTATNQYLADISGCSITQLSTMINLFEKLNFLNIKDGKSYKRVITFNRDCKEETLRKLKGNLTETERPTLRKLKTDNIYNIYNIINNIYLEKEKKEKEKEDPCKDCTDAEIAPIQQSCNNNIDKENKKEKMANSKKYEIKQYQQWYNSYIISEQSLFSLYQELHIDVRCIKELLFVFTYKLNSNKESNAFQYIEHFKNWLNTDGGKKAINDIKKV